MRNRHPVAVVCEPGARRLLGRQDVLFGKWMPTPAGRYQFADHGGKERSQAAVRDVRASDRFLATHSGLRPALASPVRLHVAEALAPCLGQAEVKLFHVGVLGQRLGRVVRHDAVDLRDVAAVGVLQRHVSVLRGQQEVDTDFSVVLLPAVLASSSAPILPCGTSNETPRSTRITWS